MPLDDLPPAPRWIRRRWLIALALLAGVVGTLWWVPTPPTRSDMVSVDTIGGSRRSRTICRFGLPSSTVTRTSPLEVRFHQLGLNWQPDWRLLQKTDRDLLGRSLGCGMGAIPPIGFLSGHPEVQQAYLQEASDEQVRQLFHILTTGTEFEQKAALRDVFDKAYAVLDARR